MRTTGLVLLAISDTALASGYHDARVAFAEGRVATPGEFVDGLAALFPFLAIGLPVLVGFRRRIPVWLAVIGAVLTITVWLGPTVALIGLHQVVLRRERSDAWRVGIAVTLATGLCTWRDLTTAAPGASFWSGLIDPHPGMPWPVPVVVTAALVALAAGTAMWSRTRTRLAETVLEVDTERQHVSDLTDQLSRQAERERLAREIHDGLGHRLSLLSVHAGALQAVASEESDDTDEIRTSAALIRESASQSMSELHSLLELLRNPDDPDVAAPRTTLRDVSTLIDESVQAGMPLVATVFVEQAQTLDPQLGQAAYRVVQELLTNARKHAPGVPVRLSVTGGPMVGSLDIATANHLALQPVTVGGPARHGSGLVGVRERVERLGGSMHSSTDPAGVFRVQIHLPWPS
jgi:signal transduction histidine kinase